MSIGTAEILVILIVGLLVFGPQRLPEVGRQVGAAVRELRKMQDSVRGELDMVLHPEHGTRSSDVAGDHDEPGDHSTGSDYSYAEPDDYPAMDIEPVEPKAIDPPDAISSNGSSGPGDAPDGERRFIGPPDSFI